MSRGGVSERIGFLRRRIAAIEAQGGAAPAPAHPRQSNELARDSFERLLDGPAAGSLNEIVPAHPRDAPAAAAVALALAARGAAARPEGSIVWIVEDMIAREIGLPYGRGLEAAGLDPARLVLARARRPRETLWAMEEALKNRAAVAVVAESWMAPRAYGLAASRRLLLAARRGGGLGLLLAPRAAGEASRLSSAASFRFEVAALPFQRAGAGRPLAPSEFASGELAWRLRLVKARAGLSGASGEFDPLRWRDLAFDPETAVFRHAFPQRLPVSPCDRPAAAPARLESA
jgi:protein ImuA